MLTAQITHRSVLRDKLSIRQSLQVQALPGMDDYTSESEASEIGMPKIVFSNIKYASDDAWLPEGDRTGVRWSAEGFEGDTEELPSRTVANHTIASHAARWKAAWQNSDDDSSDGPALTSRCTRIFR